MGVDPGLGITGYGILDCNGEEFTVVEAGVVKTNAKAPIEMRLQEIATEIQAIVNQFNPEAVAVEELYSHYGHPKTAIIMGHARGIVFLKAAEAGLPVYPYASTRIKKSLTGNGRAPKQQMQLMIRSTLGLTEVPEPPDVADALAVALCHGRMLLHNHEVASL
ncbi:MAG TPA: crossover junction endodeoxyribonuclease RuvC [candidate division Zixibacteria bacterium]|nr:crossover junction endodeoxyribonuclease RuvC [candidate division Zixibacteria bacterium]